MRPHEVNAIFDSSVDESVYAAVAKRRLAPLNAPFGVVDDVQEALF